MTKHAYCVLLGVLLGLTIHVAVATSSELKSRNAGSAAEDENNGQQVLQTEGEITWEICDCSPNFTNGYFQGFNGKASILYLNGTDTDGGELTFELDPDNSLTGVTVTADGKITWTPTEYKFERLVVLAIGSNQSVPIFIRVKLCVGCAPAGICDYDAVIVEIGDFAGVGCSCLPGFMPHPTLSARCLDINECENDICGMNATACLNSPGSYSCLVDHCVVEVSGPLGDDTCVEPMVSVCDVTGTLNSETGVLTSPYFNLTQEEVTPIILSGANAIFDCTTTISTPTFGHVIAIIFTTFDLSGSDLLCPLRFEQFLEGGERLIENPCGDERPKIYISKTNSLTITYVGILSAGVGFALKWEEDLDECISNPCDINADCVNKLGSFECKCQTGFNGDGFNCSESLVLPTIEICPCSPDYVDGYFQGEMGKMSTLYLNGTDFDGGNVTFRLAPESSLANVDVTVDGVVTWKPSSVALRTLTVTVIGKQENVDKDIALKVCLNCGDSGECAFDDVFFEISDAFTISKCSCFPGYKPNPALIAICVDVNECEDDICGMNSTACINSLGSYSCLVDRCVVEASGPLADDTCVEPMASICDVTGTLNSETGVLTSPYYNLTQEEFTSIILSGANTFFDCTTTISTQTFGHVIAISFTFFDLSGDDFSCPLKFLEGGQQLNENLCGDGDPEIYISKTNSLTIAYVAFLEVRVGFVLQWEEDLDECISNPCDINADCVNKLGSFECKCQTGFNGNGFNCSDLDECDSNPCDINADCGNTLGSFGCQCKAGFSGDGFNCSELINRCNATCNIDECVNVFGSWRCVDSICSSPVLNDRTGIIISPNFPNNYDNSLDCVTTIQAGFREVVKISFLNFTVEVNVNAEGVPGQQGCTWDWLELFDNATERSGKLCGNSLPINYTSDTNTLMIRFRSDTVYTHSGFVLMWEIENHPCVPSPCDINADCPFNNGSYQCSCIPGFTGDGINCTDINECDSNPCDSNAICINNLGSYECECSPGYTGDGFFCSIDVCMNNELHINKTEFLSSPNFPDNYGNGIFCLTTIVVPEGDSIQVSFVSFSVEPHPICNFDYVLIIDGEYDEDQDLIDDRFCGSELPPVTTSITNTLTIIFKTDGSVVTTGFRMKLEKVTIFSSVISTSKASDLPFPRGLLPFCSEAGDIEVKGGGKGARSSKLIQLTGGNGIPLGEQFFSKLQLFSDGVIVLGHISSSIANGFFNPPPDEAAFGSAPFAIFAPFWDNFQPVGRAKGNTGQMCYHDYKINPKTGKTFDGIGNDIVVRVMDVLENFFDVDDFTPTFIFKATWYKVVITAPPTLPPDAFEENHCTFQAILVTDNIKTFSFYVYGDMLYEPNGFRPVENALIGYVAGTVPIIASAGNYQPNVGFQMPNGIFKGTYFYEPSTVFNQAEEYCWLWYLSEPEWSLDLSIRSCPWTRFHAATDPRFHLSIEYKLFRDYDISEWLLDFSDLICFQPRPILQLPDPSARCCYNQAGSFVSGPFASRHELFQIPRSDVSEVTYNAALDFDLIPRRMCCYESTNPSFCEYYIEKRPLATTIGYNPCLFAFGNGDPHIVTLDEVFYTFNGLGEYYLFYSPAFLVQSRTQRAINDKGEETKATIFTAFVVKDNTSDSGNVQFELDEADSNGTSFIVKVNGVPRSVSEIEVTIENVSLSVVDGVYKAIFPSTNSFEVSANLFIADLKVVVDPALQNVSKGLLGAWSGIKEDDFELRNGTVLNYDDLLVTTDLDILDGKLSERKIYDFGQTWQIEESESLFVYGGDDYSTYNPSNPEEPPFLEDLVREQRNASYFNEVATGCTQSGVINTQCLFDTLVTNRTDIGQQTLMATNRAMDENSMNANIPPTLNVSESSQNFSDGCFQVAFGVTSTLILVASDENGDNITFSLTNASTIQHVVINPDGVLELTPTEVLTSGFLEVQADDGNGGKTTLQITVKFCYCENGGQCDYDSIIPTTDLYFKTVTCFCVGSWSGNSCNISGNTCATNRCFPGVNCTDTPTGRECGECPEGTEGDGANCTITEKCPGNCTQDCSSLLNGVLCICYNGYTPDESDPTICLDVDECALNLDNCGNNSVCLNGIGSFSCVCTNGTVEIDGECIALEDTLLQCTDKVFIGLSSSDIMRLELRDDDQIIISPSHLTNGSDLPEQCITSANSPSFNLTFGDCGANVIIGDGTLEVVYVVRNLPALDSSSLIQRYKDACFNVSCSYNTSEVVKSTGIEPMIKKRILETQLSEGNFDVEISITDSQYNSDSVSEVIVPEPIFVKLELANVEEDNDYVKLQARSCWASPDSTTGGDPLYQIVENGCPAANVFDSPGAIDVNLNYNTTIAKFSFNSFIWTGYAKSDQQIFVHCMVKICVGIGGSTCEELNCDKKRKRRFVENDPNLHVISSKPIILIAPDDSCEEMNGGCSDKCVFNGYKSHCKCFGNRILQEDGKTCSDPETIRTAGKFEVGFVSLHSFSIAAVSGAVVIFVLSVIYAMMLIRG
ncbi:uncharacterized protein LOC143462236 isoform X2 [Clavelina lepadiformis]|uniref:uncharacterized protein LOC143462236 isoform X2 n=1 Tax=Clavelina lepadiformis TaxID=159417 RepID=UPI00404190E9